MHVIIVNYNDFQRFETLESFLQYYFPLVGWARGLIAAGAEVTVFQRYRENKVISREGVLIHLVTDFGPDTTPYQIPLALHRGVVRLCDQLMSKGERVVVHLNGLLYPLQTRWLRSQLPDSVPLVLQHHGSRPWAKGLRRMIQRWGLRGVEGFLFATAELATEWVEAGIIPGMGFVYEVMETSTMFQYEERPTARAKTGLRGLPVILWAGNLDENKDPLTVLAGFADLLKDYPEARLYMAFRQAPLLEEVKHFLERNQYAAEALTLLGKVSHEAMSDLFNSADLFVQGSQKEGSGLALLECLACGVVPVVTDIPAFRTITGNGAVGALWPVGDVEALGNRLREVLKRPLQLQSKATRDFFEANWRFEAIGRRALDAYKKIYVSR